MKFLCDQCKAKYQISDDKVAGKTVRMKCRKCGHQIEVRAAVTETSVSSAMPQPDQAAPGGGAGGAQPRPPMAPSAGAPPRPQAGPRPGGLATSLSAARPAAPRASVHPPSALAGAFKSSVQKDGDETSAAMELFELSSADEWYCAINGVPVGPIRMTELRRKAALGAVTEDSLVWQEGLEEWRVAKTIPELAAIIREAQMSGRPSLVTPGPPETGARPSSPPPAASPSMRPGPMRPAAGLPRAPEPPRPHAMARNNVVPITSRLATAEKLEEAPLELQPERLSVAADPFATSAARSSVPPTSAAAMLAPPAAALPAPIEARRSAPPPWIAIAMVVLAAAFGITAAIAIFFRAPQTAPPAPAPVVIQVPAAPTAAPAPTETAAPADTSSAAAAAPNRPGGRSTAAAGKPAAAASGKAVDPSVAALLQGTGAGPSTGGPSGASGGGGSLTSDQVEAVVRNHSLGLRRTCWERGASSSPSANVTASVTVGGGGQVTSVNANGNDPAVAKCIEGAVRSWQFPPTGGQSTLSIPFHFVRQ